MSIDAILKDGEELLPVERAELMDRLRERPGPPDELSDELKALLDERIAEADANPEAGYTWEEVVTYVKRKK
jgi:putative addiction module component (TIGR02574 family)